MNWRTFTVFFACFSITGFLIYGTFYIFADREYFQDAIYSFKKTLNITHVYPKSNCSCITLTENFPYSRCNSKTKIADGANRTIYLLPRGRLGNVLFQIAATYAIAKDTGSQLAVKDNAFISSLEHRPFRTIKGNQWHELKLKYINGKHKLVDFIRAFNDSFSHSFIFRHYLQRYVFFGRCENEIRQKLALKKIVVAKADEAIAKVVRNHINSTALNNSKKLKLAIHTEMFVTVGIHVRRGDLTLKRSYAEGYRLPSISYFKSAITYFKNKYSKVVFIIVSDDKGWVQKNLLQNGIYLSPFKSPADDMALVSRCNHAITSIGTFSWWAGFLNRGTVIYYKNWMAINSKFWNEMEYKDHERYPPYWIPMS